ncbi:MAG: hypothetical protein ACPH57_06840 [Flavobacteriaceae bacterium]
MRIIPLILLLLITIIAQNKIPIFDGIVNSEEWNSSQKHIIK